MALLTNTHEQAPVAIVRTATPAFGVRSTAGVPVLARGVSITAVSTAIGYNPAFPLAHRTDLSARERSTPADVLARLDRGIADAKAGRVRPIDPTWLTADEDD
jgi:hypothetical protein